MAKGKKGKVKTGVRRRQDAECIEKEKDKTEEDEASSCSTEPQETIASFLKQEEVQELLTILQAKDLNDLPVLIGVTILGKVDLVKKFLRGGCSLECCDQNGMTPYLWAVSCKNLELVDLFVGKGADLTGGDINGDNGLIHAIKSTSWDENSAIQYQKTYKEFFSINYKNKVGNTALHFAVRRGWINFCKILIGSGADINGSNKKGVTSLMMAVSKGYEDLVLLLLQNNANAFAEDQRGCTALCYAISRWNQKNGDLSNQTVSCLLNAFPPLEKEKYLIRRLQILMNPGKRNESGNIIETFLVPVFSFFVRKVHGGLETLLKGKVFDIIFQALKNHIGQIDYTVSILEILAEVLNYCDCCVHKINPTVSESDLFHSFLGSQCPKMCTIILKHSGMSNLKNIGSPAFLPLLLVCSSNDFGRKWLQDHHADLQPFYPKFVDLPNIKYNLLTDEVHLKTIRKKAKLFKTLMAKLRNGESVVGKLETGNSSDSAKKISFDKKTTAEPEDFTTFQGRKKTKKKSKLRIAKKEKTNSKNSTSEIIQSSGQTVQGKEKSSEKENSKLEKSEKEDSKYPRNGSYDPSDLFGLLATSRSTGSSNDSDPDNCQTNVDLTDSEKEGNQVVTAISKILSISPDKSDFNIKSPTEIKQCLIEKSSDENVEPIKRDLTPALNYLDSLFEDLIIKHRKVWNYERANNYPEYKSPPMTMNEDEAMHITKLKIVLSQLEEYYLNALTEEWNQLMKIMRNKVWLSEEASNDVISKLQELLFKEETQIIDKVRKIEDEETKEKYSERKSIQNEKMSTQRMLGDIQLILDKVPDCFVMNKCEYNDFRCHQRLPSSNTLKQTTSQPRLFDEKKEPFVEGNLSQSSNGPGLELNTIFFNKGYKSDSYSEIVSVGSKTGSSHSIPTPRNDEEKKEHYSLWRKTSDNPLEKLLKTVRQMNEPLPMTSVRFCCWANEINNLQKMIANSHVQYGEILLPNPLKSGKILLPYGETGYFGSVEMGLDQKGNPVAVKHVKKLFPTSVDVLSSIMIRLRTLNNKYLLPYYMSAGFEPIIATPLMNFNLGQYVLHLKTNCSLEFKTSKIIRELAAGLHYLHTQKPPIVHGNLKPSNVLIDSNGTVKLAEFGISVALYLKKPAPPCSMIWWPGEVITSYIKLNKLRCTLAADVATAGMLVHFVLSGGQHPFGQQVKEIVDNLIVGKWNIVTTDNVAEDLISWMLVFLPENRPTIQAIVRHIYFWSLNKRWEFLLTCAGACSESGATMHDISQLYTFLDIKAKENNIEGDWKTLILSYFPNCKETVKNLSPKLTGLLNFLRQCIEDRKRTQGPSTRNGNLYEGEKLSKERFLRSFNLTGPMTNCGQRPFDGSPFIPYYVDLRSFFFNAFPVISLSIYRMLEGTQWMEVSFFASYNEPYDLS